MLQICDETPVGAHGLWCVVGFVDRTLNAEQRSLMLIPSIDALYKRVFTTNAQLGNEKDRKSRSTPACGLNRAADSSHGNHCQRERISLTGARSQKATVYRGRVSTDFWLLAPGFHQRRSRQQTRPLRCVVGQQSPGLRACRPGWCGCQEFELRMSHRR